LATDSVISPSRRTCCLPIAASSAPCTCACPLASPRRRFATFLPRPMPASPSSTCCRPASRQRCAIPSTPTAAPSASRPTTQAIPPAATSSSWRPRTTCSRAPAARRCSASTLPSVWTKPQHCCNGTIMDQLENAAQYVVVLKVGGNELDDPDFRSEEHTSELQSRENLVC